MPATTIIGLMSGSSMDGIDIAAVQFDYSLKPHFHISNYNLIAGHTYQYDDPWPTHLKLAASYDTPTYHKLHFQLGQYYGRLIRDFINTNKIEADLISSHGHTIWHEPEAHISIQMGSGYGIYEKNNLPVAFDFRSMDVALNGQGAPMSPMVDRILFPEYPIVINLGGIANLCIHHEENTTAFDSCPANQLLNALAHEAGRDYDKDGEIAAQGIVNQNLLASLDSDPFHNQKPPKSMSNEYVAGHYIPIVKQFDDSLENRMATASYFIARRICDDIRKFGSTDDRILITGGGAFNKELIKTMRQFCPNILIPDANLVNYKECILMALMGLMRKLCIPNFKVIYTGASRDNIGGIILE